MFSSLMFLSMYFTLLQNSHDNNHRLQSYNDHHIQLHCWGFGSNPQTLLFSNFIKFDCAYSTGIHYLPFLGI